MARFDIFRELTEGEERAILAMARRRKFRHNEAIFREGDPGDTVHLIDRGHVAVRMTTPAGEVLTVRIIGAGELFGELAVLDPGPRAATTVALDAVETLSLHRDVVEQLRREHSSVDRVLLRASQREVRRLSLALSEVLYTPVPTRLARHLSRLTQVFGGDVLPLTQDDLAGLCGTTRQTANHVLQELQSAGIITLGRAKLTIVDPEGLARAAR